MQNATLKESFKQKSNENGITEDHLSFLGTFNVPETNSFLECTSDNLGSQIRKTAEIQSPKRIYQVGKFKEYNKLMGSKLVKNHLGPESMNMSMKKRAANNMGPPSDRLDQFKPRRGGQIKNAVEEIIFNLEKFDMTAENLKQKANRTSRNNTKKSYLTDQSTDRTKPSVLSMGQTAKEDQFLPKVQK